MNSGYTACHRFFSRAYQLFTDLVFNIIIASLVLSPVVSAKVFAQDFDVVLQNGNSQVHYWAMDGPSNRTAWSDVSSPPGTDWVVKAIGDMDSDGVDDIVFQRLDQIHYWRMGSDGTRLETVALFPLGTVWSLVGVSDIDGDGITDLVAQHQNSQVRYFKVNAAGQGIGGQAIFGPPGVEWRAVGVGDINGDKFDDIVFQNTRTGLIHFWALDGSGDGGRSGWGDIDRASLDLEVVTVGDLDGDTDADIIVRHRQTGHVEQWYNNAGTIGSRADFGGLRVVGDWRIAGVGQITTNTSATPVNESGPVTVIGEVVIEPTTPDLSFAELYDAQYGEVPDLIPYDICQTLLEPLYEPHVQSFAQAGNGAETRVPGLYSGNDSDDTYLPFVESAFDSMKAIQRDVNGATNVQSFITELQNDAELRADFLPFFIAEAYRGLAGLNAAADNDAQMQAAITSIQRELTRRITSFQAYVRDTLRLQWVAYKTTKNWNDSDSGGGGLLGACVGMESDHGPQAYEPVTLSSILLNLPPSCTDFEPVVPTLKMLPGEKGREALEIVLGDYAALQGIKFYTDVQIEEGVNIQYTIEKETETITGDALESALEGTAFAQAMSTLGIGAAPALGIVGATVGGALYVNHGLAVAAVTKKWGFKLKDLENLLSEKIRLKAGPKQIDAAKAAVEAHKKLGKANANQIKAALQKTFGKAADKAAGKAAEKIAIKLSTKLLRTVGSVGTALGIIGVAFMFGETIAAVLPCEAWENGILDRIDVENGHQVPDFHHALVTAKEYSGGLIYENCENGYEGNGLFCIKQGCPAGYQESELYCTAEVIAKSSYTRGAGVALNCPAGQSETGGVCYSQCPVGTTEAGPLCWSQCPTGYNDTGAFCTKPADSITQDTYSRALQSRVANINGQCGVGLDRVGALCYPQCRSGYRADGLNCDVSCPAGYSDTGLTCYSAPDTIAKTSTSRGSDTLVSVGVCGTPDNPEQDVSLCYPETEPGYACIGPTCWSQCSEGYVDDGALCRHVPQDGQVSIVKQNYRRAAGILPGVYDAKPGYPSVQYWKNLKDQRVDDDLDGLHNYLDANSYTRVDKFARAIDPRARGMFRDEVFLHLMSYFIKEPANVGVLQLPPLISEF